MRDAPFLGGYMKVGIGLFTVLRAGTMPRLQLLLCCRTFYRS